MNLALSYLEEALLIIDNALTKFCDSLASTEKERNKYKHFNSYKSIVNETKSYSFDGQHFLPNDVTNFAVFGSSGVGKTSHVCYKTLDCLDNNYVVNDCSNQLLPGCGKLIDNAFTLKVSNLSHPEKSNGYYNPLWHIHNKGDIYRIVHQLVSFMCPHQDFWSLQSENIISLAIRALTYQDKKYLNFTNVRYIIELLASTNTDLVNKLMAQSNDEEVYTTYKAHIATESKVKSNILASALSHLQHWANPNIQTITSYDSLELDRITSDKYALIIQSEPLDQSFNALLVSLMVREVTNTIMSELPSNNDSSRRRILMMLDEFPTLYINDIDIIISNIRKYKSSLCIMMQSYSQLESRYNEKIAKTILTNCAARLFFTALDHQTAQSLEHELGKVLHNEGGKEFEKPMLSASELRCLSKTNAVLLYTNQKPVMLDLRPYYQQPLLMRNIREDISFKPNRIIESIPLYGN